MTIISISYAPALVLSRYFHRNELKERVIESSCESLCEHFVFTNLEYDNIRWNWDQEFEFKGRMFDVVKQYIDHKGMIHILCISDEQEIVLNEKIDHASKGNKNDSAIYKKFIKIFELKSECIPALSDSNIDFLIQREKHSIPYRNLYSSFLGPQESPPPKA